MMEEKNKIVKMHINIAEQKIPINVDIARQEQVRDVEHDIRALYEIWRRRFANKSEAELLAMMTYQYASHYHSQLKGAREAADSLNALSSQIDDFLNSL